MGGEHCCGLCTSRMDVMEVPNARKRNHVHQMGRVLVGGGTKETTNLKDLEGSCPFQKGGELA